MSVHPLRASRWPFGLWAMLALTLALAGHARSAVPAADRPTVAVEGVTYSISGPYTYQNVALYLLHNSGETDERAFITLDEGLAAGKVLVTEMPEATVEELQIDNRSDKPLYLQEGERVIGGKQDRIIQLTLVIPPASGVVTVPTYCVEANRWSRSDTAGKFTSGGNSALAPKSVRGASKYEQNQSRVWASVAKVKNDASEGLALSNTNSSINETLEDAHGRELARKLTDNLRYAPRDHKDAVGLVIAVNGKLQEVNIYVGHNLMLKVFPKLLQSYALDAAIVDTRSAKPTPRPSDVVRFIAQDRPPQREPTEINDDNRIERGRDKNRSESLSTFQGQPVHYQLMEH